VLHVRLQLWHMACQLHAVRTVHSSSLPVRIPHTCHTSQITSVIIPELQARLEELDRWVRTQRAKTVLLFGDARNSLALPRIHAWLQARHAWMCSHR
jgi:hypothetical protein